MGTRVAGVTGCALADTTAEGGKFPRFRPSKQPGYAKTKQVAELTKHYSVEQGPAGGGIGEIGSLAGSAGNNFTGHGLRA